MKPKHFLNKQLQHFSDTGTKWPLSLDLQFFAEGDGDNEGKDEKKDGEGEKVELTAAELQKKIDAEADRRLSKVLEKKQKEWDDKQKAAIDEALAKHERLSKLSEKERKDEELSAREKELADRLADISRKELKADAISDLTEKGLNTKFADFLLAEDAEKTLENINTFKELFDEALNVAVKEKLRQDSPKDNVTGSSKTSTSLKDIAKEARIIK